MRSPYEMNTSVSARGLALGGVLVPGELEMRAVFAHAVLGGGFHAMIR